MIKKILVVILLLALLLLTILPALTGRAFSDLSNENIEWLMWNKLGIMQGYLDNTMRLNEPITKAEFITIVNRSLELKGDTILRLKDVEKGMWYYKEVQTAVAVGYIPNEGELYPNNQLTYLDITPILYNLYGFTPASKDYLSNIADLPEMSSEFRSQLNTLVKENIIWEGYLKDNKPFTREQSLQFVQQLVKEKFTGSLLNMDTAFSKETLSLLNLNPKSYYYYDQSDIVDLQLGRTPSNQGDKHLGSLIIQRMTECSKKHAENNDIPATQCIWIDRNRTHIYFALETLNRDYVAYKALIYEEENQPIVGNVQQVLNYDRSQIIIKEDQEKEAARLKSLEQELELYMSMAKELNLNHNDFYLYKPSQINDLLSNSLPPLSEMSKTEFIPVKNALVTLLYKHYNGGDQPFAYWVARDSSSIYAINVKNSGYYKAFKLVAGESGDWLVHEIKTSKKASSKLSNLYKSTKAYNISKRLKELGVDESQYLYAPKDFAKSQIPAIVGSKDKIKKLEIAKASLAEMGSNSDFTPFWIHENAREAYGATVDNNKYIILKYTYSLDSNKWISQQVYPVYKETKYTVPKQEKNLFEELSIDISDYTYYPYNQRSIFVHNQSGSLINSSWDIGERLANTVDYAFNVENTTNGHYPNFLVHKDGLSAYSIRTSTSGEDKVFYHKLEWCLTEKDDESIIFPTWGTQQVLPKNEPQVFKAPTEYISSMVKVLKVNPNDYTYYPQSEQNKLVRRNPSLFKDSCIAGLMAFNKGSKLLREYGISTADKEMGCFIHPSGDNVYIIQEKADGITYIYKLVLDKTAEGYIQWNDVAEWKLSD